MFTDRKDAGIQLGEALEEYSGEDVLTLGIPRGGVEVAHHVARILDSDFSILVTRKLPLPNNPEAGFGAIAEDGSMYIIPEAKSWVSRENRERIKRIQKEEIRRRIEALRGGRDLPDISGRTVILVDDGIAMGSTMSASIEMCKNTGAEKVIAAAPVGSPRSVDKISSRADRVLVLERPRSFRAVANYYENWYDVPDEEVIEIMEKRRSESASQK